MYEPFTIVGINALFFGKKDMANRHVLAAQLESWLPTPWRASIREYCIVLLISYLENLKKIFETRLTSWWRTIARQSKRNATGSGLK